MSAITDRYARARQMSRALFPTWSRRMRAKWVLAKLRAGGMQVPISSAWAHDERAFKFLRTAP